MHLGEKCSLMSRYPEAPATAAATAPTRKMTIWRGPPRRLHRTASTRIPRAAALCCGESEGGLGRAQDKSSMAMIEGGLRRKDSHKTLVIGAEKLTGMLIIHFNKGQFTFLFDFLNVRLYFFRSVT